MSPELRGDVAAGGRGAKLRALRAQAVVLPAQVCTRAGGKDPVPFYFQGAMERAGIRESRIGGTGLHPTHPH